MPDNPQFVAAFPEAVICGASDELQVVGYVSGGVLICIEAT
jgi:hypothetical protein